MTFHRRMSSFPDGMVLDGCSWCGTVGSGRGDERPCKKACYDAAYESKNRPEMVLTAFPRYESRLE